MEYGVRGMLLYGDPIDFAKEGTVYSNSGKWWLPETGIIRESVLMVPGDPQTPGLVCPKLFFCKQLSLVVNK